MIQGVQVVVFRNVADEFGGLGRRKSVEALEVTAGGNGSGGQRRGNGRPFRVMPHVPEVARPSRREIEEYQEPERWDGLA